MRVTKTWYKRYGNRWSQTDETTEDMPLEWVHNIIDAIPFFRNLGGREIVMKRFTRYGKMPYRIHSISPDGTSKCVININWDAE